MSEKLKEEKHSHHDSTYKHILKYTGVFGGVEGLKMLVGLLKNKLTAIYLGSAGMGLGAIYANIVENLNSATNFGLSFSAMRSVSETFEEGTDEEVKYHVRVVRTWSLWTALLAALLCLGGSPWITDWFFPEGGNVWHVVLLSLIVVAMPVEAGECAVLKGMRKLKRVAIIEVFAVFSTLLTTIPLYIWMGVAGVIYALVLTQLVVTFIHLTFSVTIVPYHVSLFSQRVFKDGLGLLKLGIPYALAAVASAVTMGAIIHFIEDHGQIGLYKSAMLIMAVSSGLAFTAMDVDFFPRLSAVNHDQHRTNCMVNQQIDVCAMALGPIMLLLLAALPYLVPLLLTKEFTPIMGLCAFGVMQTYLRGLTTPLEYVPLAKGQSVVYLIVEMAAHGLNYAFILWLYPMYGLLGAGMALALAQFTEMVLVYTLYSSIFGFAISRCTFFYSVSQMALLSIGIAMSLYLEGWLQLATLAVLCAVSAFYSVHVLGKDAPVFQRFVHRSLRANEDDCCGHE